MTDFSLEKVPSSRVASIVHVGGWKEDHLRAEFRELTRWAKQHRIRTGRWIFVDVRASHRRWEACLEVRGAAVPEGRIRIKTLPASWVAKVVFNPEQVSSRLVYHGLNDWTKWRRRTREIRSVTSIREVFSADPWKVTSAWENCEVQYLVRR